MRLPAEWEPQSFVQFTFPHPQTDWKDNWQAALDCFVSIIEIASQWQPVLIVGQQKEAVLPLLRTANTANLYFAQAPSNDSWSRDHGGITVVSEDEKATILDFTFNGWGQKFPATLDNQITSTLFHQGVFQFANLRTIDLVFEGGSIESDGAGTLLSTSECLLSPLRNPHLSQSTLTDTLLQYFGAQRLLWLDHGALLGDDTDAHIDTLARFCSPNTIIYVQCTQSNDPHFTPLSAMEAQLRQFQQLNGQPYQLIPLPLPSPQFAPDGHRIPATYANFLIINGAVLVPTYACKEDAIALEQLQECFPNRQIIGIDCRPLIQQHGSLHCISMQYPSAIQLSSKFRVSK